VMRTAAKWSASKSSVSTMVSGRSAALSAIARPAFTSIDDLMAHIKATDSGTTQGAN